MLGYTINIVLFNLKNPIRIRHGIFTNINFTFILEQIPTIVWKKPIPEMTTIKCRVCHHRCRGLPNVNMVGVVIEKMLTIFETFVILGQLVSYEIQWSINLFVIILCIAARTSDQYLDDDEEDESDFDPFAGSSGSDYVPSEEDE